MVATGIARKTDHHWQSWNLELSGKDQTLRQYMSRVGTDCLLG